MARRKGRKITIVIPTSKKIRRRRRAQKYECVSKPRRKRRSTYRRKRRITNRRSSYDIYN